MSDIGSKGAWPRRGAQEVQTSRPERGCMKTLKAEELSMFSDRGQFLTSVWSYDIKCQGLLWQVGGAMTQRGVVYFNRWEVPCPQWGGVYFDNSLPFCQKVVYTFSQLQVIIFSLLVKQQTWPQKSEESQLKKWPNTLHLFINKWRFCIHHYHCSWCWFGFEFHSMRCYSRLNLSFFTTDLWIFYFSLSYY